MEKVISVFRMEIVFSMKLTPEKELPSVSFAPIEVSFGDFAVYMDYLYHLTRLT